MPIGASTGAGIGCAISGNGSSASSLPTIGWREESKPVAAGPAGVTGSISTRRLAGGCGSASVFAREGVARRGASGTAEHGMALAGCKLACGGIGCGTLTKLNGEASASAAAQRGASYAAVRIGVSGTYEPGTTLAGCKLAFGCAGGGTFAKVNAETSASAAVLTGDAYAAVRSGVNGTYEPGTTLAGCRTALGYIGGFADESSSEVSHAAAGAAASAGLNFT